MITSLNPPPKQPVRLLAGHVQDMILCRKDITVIFNFHHKWLIWKIDHLGIQKRSHSVMNKRGLTRNHINIMSPLRCLFPFPIVEQSPYCHQLEWGLFLLEKPRDGQMFHLYTSLIGSQLLLHCRHLSSCAELDALDWGCWIHTYLKKKVLDINFLLTTSLVDMYSKCGVLDKALMVFGSMCQRDVFVWSTMIGGLAMHGRGKDALELFLPMLRAQVKPNSVTFTNVLCACSHSGLVEEGRLYFAQMLPVYGIEPKPEHYASMVDILGRAGLVEEARELVVNMPMQPPASVWRALLGVCVLHKNVELANKACAHLLELDPGNDGAYVLLPNLHAESGNWAAVLKLRKQMKHGPFKFYTGFLDYFIRIASHVMIVWIKYRSFRNLWAVQFKTGPHSIRTS